MTPNDTNLQPQAILARLFPPVEESSRLTVASRRANYSAGAIARAVEDCDCHLLNLNLTAPVVGSHDPLDDTVTVDLRVSRRDPAAVARSLERYGFRVIDGQPSAEASSDAATDEVRRRVNELIHFLNV